MDVNAIEVVRPGVGITSESFAPVDSLKAVIPPSSPPRPPESDSVTLSDFAKKRVKLGMESNAGFQRKLSMTKNNQVVMKVIDQKTQNIVRQTPPEEQLKLKEAARKAAENFKI